MTPLLANAMMTTTLVSIAEFHFSMADCLSPYLDTIGSTQKSFCLTTFFPTTNLPRKEIGEQGFLMYLIDSISPSTKPNHLRKKSLLTRRCLGRYSRTCCRRIFGTKAALTTHHES